MGGSRLLDPFHNFIGGEDWLGRFQNFDIVQFEKALRTHHEDFWTSQGERRALRIFHSAATRVPAYKDFLKKHRIRASSISTIEDFQYVPWTDKKNYISKYPLALRCWDGKLRTADLIAVSSGTSGEPTYWPRGGYQEFEAGVVHELMYRYLFEMHRCTTLVLIGFPMGVYVSGIATVIPTRMVADKEYPVTMVCVGNNKAEMLRAIHHLASAYDQVLLVGHPLFIKDVVETGKEEKISWKRHRLRMLFCSEGFNESWRRYVIKRAGISFDWNTVVSAYGSSELLLMAHETPISIWLRSWAESDPSVSRRLFGNSIVPNLFQYNPLLRYIENSDRELIFTASSGVPLVKYNLHDAGVILGQDELFGMLDGIGGHWRRGANLRGVMSSLWKLPFVALSGRSDHTVIFYAANIYPEHIRAALDRREFFGKLTGKFVIRKGYLQNKDEFLEVNIELNKNVRPSRSLALGIQSSVVQNLRTLNMEYLFLCNHLDKDITPRIKLLQFQDDKYFRVGLKPRWVSA